MTVLKYTIRSYPLSYIIQTYTSEICKCTNTYCFNHFHNTVKFILERPIYVLYNDASCLCISCIYWYQNWIEHGFSNICGRVGTMYNFPNNGTTT